RAVERVVDLDGRKPLRVVRQHLRRRQRLRIEAALPLRVVVPRRAHPDRHYACFAQRTSVPKSGALPCISNPTLNTLAANQIATHAAAMPTTSVSSTCQVGGGVFVARRIIIANVFTGGMKLMATANVEFGSRPMTLAKSHGAMSASMTGVISDCASRISLTAAP